MHFSVEVQLPFILVLYRLQITVNDLCGEGSVIAALKLNAVKHVMCFWSPFDNLEKMSLGNGFIGFLCASSLSMRNVYLIDWSKAKRQI